jgi:hypothetical protein
MLDAGFGFESNFYTFAAVAALGLVAIGFVPRPTMPASPVSVPAKEEMPA